MATPSPGFLKPSEFDAPEKPSGGTPNAAASKARKGFPRGIVFIALCALLIAGAVSCLVFLRHRARTHHTNLASGTSLNASHAKEASPEPAVELPLEPFVVNLADAGGHSYARIGLTLRLAVSGKSESKDQAATNAAGSRDMVRDTIITVLNQEQSAELLAPSGKEHLKQAVRAAVAARDPQLHILDIYFTEFLIQQ